MGRCQSLTSCRGVEFAVGYAGDEGGYGFACIFYGEYRSDPSYIHDVLFNESLLSK